VADVLQGWPTILVLAPGKYLKGSLPFKASVARKMIIPLERTKLLGELLEDPGRISATMTVPVVVPSVFQSSDPEVAFLATKKAKRDPERRKLKGKELKDPG